MTRCEKMLTAAVLMLLFACVCLAIPNRPTRKAWYECGTNASGKVTVLVGHPRCCVGDLEIVEGCAVMFAAKVK